MPQHSTMLRIISKICRPRKKRWAQWDSSHVRPAGNPSLYFFLARLNIIQWRWKYLFWMSFLLSKFILGNKFISFIAAFHLGNKLPSPIQNHKLDEQDNTCLEGQAFSFFLNSQCPATHNSWMCGNVFCSLGTFYCTQYSQHLPWLLPLLWQQCQSSTAFQRTAHQF